eukprot:scaffold73987_cov70-Phaeocystis_antarctica.AAC.1
MQEVRDQAGACAIERSVACLLPRTAAAARSEHVDRDGEQEGARAHGERGGAPLAVRVAHAPTEELQQDHGLAVGQRAADDPEARLQVAQQEVRRWHLHVVTRVSWLWGG